MDFSHSARSRELLDRLDRFMREAVIPAEPVYASQPATTDDTTKADSAGGTQETKLTPASVRRVTRVERSRSSGSRPPRIS